MKPCPATIEVAEANEAVTKTCALRWDHMGPHSYLDENLPPGIAHLRPWPNWMHHGPDPH